ncbi:MAG: TonB-dependent receptor, partial [Proteobacteria bacterium]|nr:TonB-dependent receptor [Pseudomonadota bacterium]
MKLFRNHRMGLLLGAALPLVAASAGTAVAQDTGTGETATQQTAATGNDIIVTATRRPQTLLDVPLSVAVVSGDSLAKMGTRQFNDLQGSVPNHRSDQTYGNFVINMGGLGSGGGSLAFERS